MTYNVLVVDDYEPWRSRVTAELSKSPRWRVVCECADGGDAVREASARQPDLVILDIGLKTMNGVEAARRILASDPRVRILFLTAQQSPDVAQAALATGAHGYLLKLEAGGALLRAVEAVAAGAHFISPGLPADLVHGFTPPPSGHCHHAVFRSTQAALADEYSRFAANALGRGQPVLILTERASLDQIRQQLEARGVAVSRAIDAGRYQALDRASQASKLMPNGRYDRERFRVAAAAILDSMTSAAAGQRVALCGDMAPQLWNEGRGDVTIDIERIWDDTMKGTGTDMLCGYCVDASRLAEREYSMFRDICDAHRAVQVR